MHDTAKEVECFCDALNDRQRLIDGSEGFEHQQINLVPLLHCSAVLSALVPHGWLLWLSFG